jgi:hypothetical protein
MLSQSQGHSATRKLSNLEKMQLLHHEPNPQSYHGNGGGIEGNL